MDGWNTRTFPFGARPNFRGEMAVSLPEGNSSGVVVMILFAFSTGLFERAGENKLVKNQHGCLEDATDVFPVES